jgi:hypothetical protein
MQVIFCGLFEREVGVVLIQIFIVCELLARAIRKCVGFIFTELVACSDISETLLKTPLLQIKKIYISLTGYDVIL